MPKVIFPNGAVVTCAESQVKDLLNSGCTIDDGKPKKAKKAKKVKLELEEDGQDDS
jgi:hypothetical protein